MQSNNGAFLTFFTPKPENQSKVDGVICHGPACRQAGYTEYTDVVTETAMAFRRRCFQPRYSKRLEAASTIAPSAVSTHNFPHIYYLAQRACLLLYCSTLSYLAQRAVSTHNFLHIYYLAQRGPMPIGDSIFFGVIPVQISFADLLCPSAT